jgi:hypothetical protein
MRRPDRSGRRQFLAQLGCGVGALAGASWILDEQTRALADGSPAAATFVPDAEIALSATRARANILRGERLQRFARIVGEDHVVAGTDCGFSTFAGLHTVDPAIAWAKLEALVQGAGIASRALRRASQVPGVVAHA